MRSVFSGKIALQGHIGRQSSMKKRFVILIVAALAACFALIGCGSETEFLDRESAVKVVFKLEGGEYQNSPADLVYYYAFKKGTTNLIKDPAAEKETDKFNSSTVKRDDYYLDGWYRTRVEIEDGTTEDGKPKYKVEYDNKWDFKTDRVDDDGVQLYACWVKLIHYTYGVYYINENGEEVMLGSKRYIVDAGDKFNDRLDYASKREGWSPTGYFQDPECTIPWDEDFVHPGGDVNTEIKVYVGYEEGEFVEVSTASELVANRWRDIKLTNDIDMSTLTEDEKKKFAGSFFGYGRIFDGNGYAVKNLDMTYSVGRDDLLDGFDIDESGNFILGISLFGVSSGAKVRNVRFENVSVNVDLGGGAGYIQRVILAPLFLKAENATLTNVHFDGTYTVSDKISQDFIENKFDVVTDSDKYGCYKNTDSVFENVEVIFSKTSA